MSCLSRRVLLAGAFGLANAADASPYRTPYKIGRLVLAADPAPQSFDSRSVDCPFVFRHDSPFYMTYIGWDGTGYQTGLASSADLIHWQKAGSILRRDPASAITRYNVAMNWILRDLNLRSKGELHRVNGRYLGVFHAYPNPGLEEGPAVIGLCWSDNLRDWTIGDVVLQPAEGAPWEQGGLYKPCLVEKAGTYYLFYNAKSRNLPKSEGGGWREQTGVATSTDLKTWKRFGGNPVIRNGPPGSPDERFASDPCVMTDGGKWLLFYFGLDRKGAARDLLAIGDDPFHFQKENGILIDTGPPGSVDATYAHKPSVIWHNGALYHFYCAVSGKWPNETRGISVACSRPWPKRA